MLCRWGKEFRISLMRVRLEVVFRRFEQTANPLGDDMQEEQQTRIPFGNDKLTSLRKRRR